ncbi:MAG: hypothetical protein D6694_08395 [Gammaproteobacteria bacterium]|nr:MAG: hypothetical protein D6694_08395 [Gammaproteobacteria bacterium]
MTVYDIDKLMAQTRSLAAEYRAATGQVLPVSSELAIYDACRHLGLRAASEHRAGVDVVGEQGAYQIKSRVCFDPKKRGYRLGRVNTKGDWTHVLLVVYDARYEPLEIWQAERKVVEEALTQARPNPRGSMTIEKFKAIGHCVWRRAAENTNEC